MIMQREGPEEFQKQILQEIKELEEKLSTEELDLLEKKHSLERMYKEREHAKMKEGRETLDAKRWSYPHYGKWIPESGHEGRLLVC